MSRVSVVGIPTVFIFYQLYSPKSTLNVPTPPFSIPTKLQKLLKCLFFFLNHYKLHLTLLSLLVWFLVTLKLPTFAFPHSTVGIFLIIPLKNFKVFQDFFKFLYYHYFYYYYYHYCFNMIIIATIHIINNIIHTIISNCFPIRAPFYSNLTLTFYKLLEQGILSH